MSWHDVRAAALIAVAGLAVAAPSCNGGGPSEPNVLPSVRIDAPGNDTAIVRDPSFEVGGEILGSTKQISVAVDGADVGQAIRGDTGRWRLAANRFSIGPGLHQITATATGDGGTDSSSLWVWYEPDIATTFQIAVVPDAATYGPGDSPPDDPRVLLFGPADNEIQLDLTAEAPPPITANINSRLSTGSHVNLDLQVDDPPPATYPIVVRGVSDTGESHEATHTITIVGPPPTTTPPPTERPPTQPPPSTGAGPTVVLSDDFEGADHWSATVTASTNGSQATAEVAAGGNPGGQRRMTHLLPGTDDGENNPTEIVVLHTYAGGGWDPATDGPLARVNYAEDQIEYEPPFEGAAIGARFVIVQDGTLYMAAINANSAYDNTTWQTTRVDGLTPEDFSPAPGPDFSASGAPMTFGYLRVNTTRSAAGLTAQHGIDNWTVELIGAAG